MNLKPDADASKDYMIWHYTSAEVFMEFMKDNSCLYATHYNFLNDAEEISYGCQLCLQLLRKNPHLSRYANDVAKELGHADVFLCCFSKQPDSLYQWRSYTPGGGFSIGFSMQHIKQLLRDAWINEDRQYWQVKGTYIDGEENAVTVTYSDAEKNFILENYDDDRLFHDFYYFFVADCIYDLEEQKNIFQNFLQREYDRELTDPQIYNNNPVCPIHNPGEINIDYHHKLMIVNAIKSNAVQFKNPTFSFEEEIRIVYESDGFLNKRLVYIGGKPRIPTHVKNLRDLIKCVFISPHGDRAKNRKLAEMFREKYDLEFEIKDSYSSFVGG